VKIQAKCKYLIAARLATIALTATQQLNAQNVNEKTRYYLPLRPINGGLQQL
jgi:hypothetical protein